jgi:hypothetical protein
VSHGLGGGTLRGQVPLRCLDLSAGGALLVMSAPLEVGAIHDFALEVEGDTLWVQGEVRHCHPSGPSFQVGVQFLGIDPQDERRLRAYLQARG